MNAQTIMGTPESRALLTQAGWGESPFAELRAAVIVPGTVIRFTKPVGTKVPGVHYISQGASVVPRNGTIYAECFGLWDPARGVATQAMLEDSVMACIRIVGRFEIETEDDE